VSDLFKRRSATFSRMALSHPKRPYAPDRTKPRSSAIHIGVFGPDYGFGIPYRANLCVSSCGTDIPVGFQALGDRIPLHFADQAAPVRWLAIGGPQQTLDKQVTDFIRYHGRENANSLHRS
jgi:hypothetical protein